MRGLRITLPILALIGLAACEEQTMTLTFGGSDAGPSGFKQAECLEFQLRMDDTTLPSFTRDAAREDFNRKDCVYRSQDDSPGILTPLVAS